MTSESGQKFIARNRAPRVQIEYDVELFGAERKVQLPFVMGVLADLSGSAPGDRAPIEERKLLEIDAETFDARLKGIAPRVVADVPNRLDDQGGRLRVELQIERMDDFSPAAVARKVEPVRRLLEARQRLANLLTYMDGKAGTEAVLAELLRDRRLLASVAADDTERT